MQNTKLPKIVAVLAKDDHGPCDAGATAVCPHCGADGRYVYTFLCDDGTTRGAMAGCIKLFPRSIAADECEKALAKSCAARGGKGYLSRWDERMLNAIEQLQNGAIDCRTLEAIAQGIKMEKRNWMRSKGYCR
jgi:hypothetical protein